MEYRLVSKFADYRRAIALVGCGGTGGFAAEGLCRLLLAYRPLHLILIDGDRVEERNLGRQNFYPEDLGRFKSQALAERLTRKYRHAIAYTISPFGGVPHSCALVVGCVDNAPARAAIAGAMNASGWWIDAGNGHEFGQVLIGNATGKGLEGFFEGERCHALPLPTLVRAELLAPAPRPSCAEAQALGEQGPTINQFMAALVVEMVRRLLEGRLSWWQVYLDLEVGSLRTVAPTPEAVARLTGTPLKKLLRR